MQHPDVRTACTVINRNADARNAVVGRAACTAYTVINRNANACTAHDGAHQLSIALPDTLPNCTAFIGSN